MRRNSSETMLHISNLKLFPPIPWANKFCKVVRQLHTIFAIAVLKYIQKINLLEVRTLHS